MGKIGKLVDVVITTGGVPTVVQLREETAEALIAKGVAFPKTVTTETVEPEVKPAKPKNKETKPKTK